MKVINGCEVLYLQIMDESGKIVNKKEMPKISNEDIKKMYWFMILSRAFDEQAIAMQRQGRIYTYASLRGQEASQIGSAFAMKKTDIAFPSFREHGVFLTRGATMEGLLLYHKGDERGSCSKNVNVFTPSIPVASQIFHATGAGMAFSYRKEKRAAMAYFGDGATSKGDFHESLNFAGVFNANTVFLCQNNQYAISLPVSQQTVAQTIAQKAIAYGIKGMRVDGNDVFAVYAATKQALQDAYEGKPTLIECLTYRLSDHTTSDDALKYRSLEEVKKHKKEEPISRLRNYMYAEKIMTKSEDANLQAQAKKEIEAAVKRFEETKPYPAEDIIKYLYEELSPELQSQIEDIKDNSQGVK